MKPVAATKAALGCLLLAVIAAGAAAGQTVYRCGPAGNQYSALPCDDGRPIDVSDRRSAEQIGDARKAVADQRRLALALARERKETEQAKPPALAGAIGPAPAAAAPKSANKPKSKPASRKASAKVSGRAENGEEFVAVVPGSGKPAKKKKKPSGDAE